MTRRTFIATLGLMLGLIACPDCHVHCKLSELDCPHCGTRLRARDGRIAQTKAAILLGLTVASVAGAACGTPKYGAPPAPPADTTKPSATAPDADANATAVPADTAGAAEPSPAAPEYGVPVSD